ncbi:MAG TPA: hypothetical protein PLC06_09315, partial [Promineifilum sp.]|nr:hypothetical protein [Promineifilum sp.]
NPRSERLDAYKITVGNGLSSRKNHIILSAARRDYLPKLVMLSYNMTNSDDKLCHSSSRQVTNDNRKRPVQHLYWLV